MIEYLFSCFPHSHWTSKIMDLNETWDYFQQQTLPTEPASLDQRMEETPVPTFPTLSPSDLETILNSLFPSEETIRSHIDSEAEYTVDNNNNDHDMDSLEPIKDTSQECSNQISSNGISQDCQCNHMTSNSILDNLEQLLTSSFIKKPESSDISNSSPPIETQLPSQESTQSSSEPQNGFKEVETLPSHLRRPYTDPQSNNLTPMDPGFKPVLSLCTDPSKVKEPWRPKVAKKILAAYYTPLNLKSEFLATQASLDEFQSLVLKEAVSAFHDVALVNTIIYKIGLSYPDSCPKILVGTCRKLRAYRRLQMDDRVTLLSSVFFDVVAMKSVLTYDHLTDSWNCSGIRVDRRDVFRLDSSLHNGIVHVIETFPDRWRKDLTVAALLYLIIIFNPDLPNLKFKESIRLEQYTYIYLLQRYLESTCEFPYDASDYHYRLMVKIEEIQNLRKHMRNVFEMFIINYSLSGCISKLVECND